ncbi:hypothetical protein [Streptomyces pinistramenti]|uniref:hypothetical protein n=1 Tax=Streptomyces pinistramenti TaxID=2884812 RepID=UPI001D07D370|nr:hypothetical protein [Streptomyces pinistramenti]MCB5911550.1 hypothetical protein [Streptomyces pinistramenti]
MGSAAYPRASQDRQRRVATRSVLPAVARNGSDTEIRDQTPGAGAATHPNFGAQTTLSER